MNWVGGSRFRFIKKNDNRKQKEFFERKRMQDKMKSLGVLPSPSTEATGSMDLITLFMVNQIASKKEITSQPRITNLEKMMGSQKALNKPLELPMSPGSPSQLCLAESQPTYSTQPRENTDPREKRHKVSLVLESKVPDNSTSECQHHIRDTFSPVSSASSVHSAHMFPLQSLNTHESPQPWELPLLEQSQFINLSHPNRGEEYSPWLEEMTESAEAEPAVNLKYSFSPESREQLALFAEGLSRLSKENEWQQPFFFCSEEYGAQGRAEQQANLFLRLIFTLKTLYFSAPMFDKEVKKIHVQDNSAITTPGNFRGAESTDHHTEFVDEELKSSDHSKCYLGSHDSIAVSDSPNYTSRQSSTSSESDDEEGSCCGNMSVKSQLSLRKWEAATKLKTTKSLKNSDSDVCSKVGGSGGFFCPVSSHFQRRRRKFSEDQFVPSQAPLQDLQRRCNPKKKPQTSTNKTRDTGSQTAVTMTNASTQCPFPDEISISKHQQHRKSPWQAVYLPNPTTWGQCSPENNPSGQIPHSNTPWSASRGVKGQRCRPTPPFHGGSRCLNQSHLNKSQTEILDNHQNNPIQEADMEEQPSKQFTEEKENGEVREMKEICQPHEKAEPMKEPVIVMDELVHGGGKHVSEEAETLQEIADILLMLKKKKSFSRKK
ncbi:uncharacterized protein redic1 isoform X2 [Denticeps clupeoides]|uniref:uncharacterized protein redic1 isoform X2 n=1 Tax=Denticeps clupeoides TaxID=299321 RepID=UPI0010A2DB14|nr:uncharacterized protein C12orf40 homolog isoform X2 [Denticeps clupeoides]